MPMKLVKSKYDAVANMLTTKVGEWHTHDAKGKLAKTTRYKP